MKELKKRGSPFSQKTSEEYKPLQASDYRRIICGEPHQKSKDVPMLQVADLVLYAIAKGGYKPDYTPYKDLKDGGKLIDSCFSEEERASRGIKYSCFPTQKD